MLRFAAALLVSLFLCGTARAQYITPESGWYWNSSLSGSGYNIEFQDSTMFLSFFSYNAQRQSAFYTISGQFNVATGRVVGDFFSFSNGQCIGCPYNPPTVTALGTATVQFINGSRAIITLPSPTGPVSTTVERFVFGLNPNLTGRDIGAWFTTIVFRDGGLPEGDVIRIRRTENTTQGLASVGDIFPSGRLIVGAPAAITGTAYNYAWLIDLTPSSNALYVAEFTVNGFGGEYFVYPKGTTPSGIGLVTYGARLAGPNTANQVLGLSGGNTQNAEGFSAKRLGQAMGKGARGKAAQSDLTALAARLEAVLANAH